jgi:hypothetical protein
VVVRRQKQEDPTPNRRRPATTPDARENQLISLAVDLAERQLRDGTASAQVISHYLKAGSRREQLEQQRIKYENELLKVKKDQIESQQRVEELYLNALNAMQSYTGNAPPEEPDEYED